MDGFWYGADYNPEQWPRATWDDDIQLMRHAGVTVVTIGVFSWAELEPEEGRFEVEWLDELFDRLHAAGIRIDLATATASPPPWLSHAYPETLLVDEWRHTLSPGSRQHVNPASATYRRLAARLVRMLAERYGSHPALVAWHVGNEYANDNPRDYGDETAADFRAWLARKYGSIDTLNERWGTAFWSQSYASFTEILPPRAAPTFRNPAQLLDFERYSSDAHLAGYLAEAAIVREASPGIPVTTNFMGLFRDLDYWRWAREVDFASDDAYPDPARQDSWKEAALQRDLMRSLKPGVPWILMEQSTSAVNWRPLNAPKRPGQMRALSYQAIARGADGIMFFQWRQSRRGGERFHSAMVPHAGTEGRIWREVTRLGRELRRLAPVAGTRTEPADVALLLDWDSWWSLEQPALPARVDYAREIASWHHALLDLGMTTDFVSADSELSGYRVLIVPNLLVTRDDLAGRLEEFVRAGGHLLVTFLSGVTDVDAALSQGGLVGPFGKLLGITVEEFAPHPAGDRVRVVGGVRGATGGWAELLHSQGAEVIARFEGGFADGAPAVTRLTADDGAAWYVGTDLEPAGRHQLLEAVTSAAGVPGGPAAGIPDVEVVRRDRWLFAINHGAETSAIDLSGRDTLTGEHVERVELPPFGVAVLESPAATERLADPAHEPALRA